MKIESDFEALLEELEQIYGGRRAARPDDSQMVKMSPRQNVDIECNPL